MYAVKMLCSLRSVLERHHVRTEKPGLFHSMLGWLTLCWVVLNTNSACQRFFRPRPVPRPRKTQLSACAPCTC